MNLFWKIIFWTLVIALGFVSPVISFGLIVLYYLPEIIRSLCQTCKEVCEESVESTEHNDESVKTTSHPNQHGAKMDSFSEDTLEGMK